MPPKPNSNKNSKGMTTTCSQLKKVGKKPTKQKTLKNQPNKVFHDQDLQEGRIYKTKKRHSEKTRR